MFLLCKHVHLTCGFNKLMVMMIRCQTDRPQTKASLNASAHYGRGYNNPNHNYTPRTENSLEQIQLSVFGDRK